MTKLRGKNVPVVQIKVMVQLSKGRNFQQHSGLITTQIYPYR